MQMNKEATKAELETVGLVGKRLRTFLVHKNITFAEAASILEVSPSMITRLAEGVNMTVDILERVVAAFPDLNYDWLMTGEGAMEAGTDSASGIDYLFSDATAEEFRTLQWLKEQYEALPAYDHGPLTERGVEVLQKLMDEAMYLDRLGLLITQRSMNLVMKVTRMDQTRKK